MFENIYINEDKTILNEYLSIYEVRGLVNSTSDYALPGYKNNNKGEITLGEEVYLINSHSLNAFFGMNVIGYYKYDEDNDESKILSLKARKEGSFIEIQANNIDSYENGVYTYTLENSAKSKTIKLPAGVQWYYNYEPVFTKVQMNNVNFIPEVGSVKFIDSNDDSKYDIVAILDYDVRVVDYVREENIFIKNQGNKIEVNDETIIRDVNGNPIDSALSLSQNDVVHTIFEKDGVTAKYIVVTYDSVEDVVGGIYKADKSIILKGGSEYTVTEEKSTFLDEIKIGSNITLYLDMNKNIAGYTMSATDTLLYGYMFDMRKVESEETGEDIIVVKLYDVSENIIKTVRSADKLNINYYGVWKWCRNYR